MRKQLLILCLFQMLVISVYSSYDIEVNFTTLEGTVVSFTRYEGQYLLVDAMATWSQSNFIQTEYINNISSTVLQYMNLLSISIDPESDTLDDLLAYKNSTKAGWEFGLDHAKEFSNHFSITLIPTLLFIDIEGFVIHKWEGLTKAHDIMNLILPFFINNTSTNSQETLTSTTPFDTNTSESSGKLEIPFQWFPGIISSLLIIYFRKLRLGKYESI